MDRPLDIASWLRELGLGRYVDAFLAADVDAEVLADLGDDDLRQLGVSLGHRKKLLRAIADLAPRLGAPGPARRTAAAPAGRDQAPAAPRGERRHLTVLFCDLVDSTALVQRLDPEDMAEVYRAYHARCLDVVARWGGHLAQFTGDGALAYFGYPHAHEDDAQRAVHAGLALVAAVGALQAEPGAPLRARVGVATGLVLISALTGGAQDGDVVGDTVNLAARLQTVAEPGEVVVGDGTRRLLGATFELASLGRRQLKGFAQPAEVWRVDRALGRARSRFAARSPGRLAPLAGREEDLAQLVDRWAAAKTGRGQVVLISGEAGIGKSRIVHALGERLGDEPFARLSYHCSPYHTASAWHPVIGQLEFAAGIEDGDGPEARLDKLEALLGAGGADLAADLPVIAGLMSLDLLGRYSPAPLSPQQAKTRTMEALHAQLLALTSRGPVLIVVEDAHWVDPSFKEMLDFSVERIAALPVLLVVTFRPEYATGWHGRPHVSLILPSRLDRGDALAVVTGLLGADGVSSETAAQLVEKADGVPLFLEELTRMVIEAPRSLQARARGRAGVGVPETLQELLMARLDRLGAEKEVAQMGAVIGREFARDVLARATSLPEAALDAALRRLIDAELIYERSGPGRRAYVFRHVLMRDAAYDSLMRVRRQTLHARLAQVLETEFSNRVEAQPELLAQHHAGAGNVDRSIDYWLRAGRRAIERSALVEAAQHLTYGLDQLETLPASPSRDRRELALRTALGPALLVTKGYGATEVRVAFERLRALCHRPGDREDLFLALRGLWANRFVRAELRAATETAEELLRLAGDDPAMRLEAHRALGMSMLYRGDFLGAARNLGAGAEIYDPDQHHNHAFRFGNDPGVVCLSYGAKALWCLGRAAEARANSARALELADRLNHPFSRTQAHALAAMLAQHAADEPATIAQAEASIVLAERYSFPYWDSLSRILRGWALARVARRPDAVEGLRKGIDGYRATGSELAVPWFLALEAEALDRLGAQARGLDALDQAVEMARRNDDLHYLAEIHRVTGDLHANVGGEGAAAEAEAAYAAALDVAAGQRAALWTLRAAVGRARLRRGGPGEAEARDALLRAAADLDAAHYGADLAAARHVFAATPG